MPYQGFLQLILGDDVVIKIGSFSNKKQSTVITRGVAEGANLLNQDFTLPRGAKLPPTRCLNSICRGAIGSNICAQSCPRGSVQVPTRPEVRPKREVVGSAAWFRLPVRCCLRLAHTDLLTRKHGHCENIGLAVLHSPLTCI